MAGWREVVRTVAPVLATTLGGPLAGIAVREVSEALLGRPDGTEQEVSAAVLSGGPEVLVKLKEVEARLQEKLLQAGVDLERLAAEDRASARQMAISTGDLATPRALALLVVGGFFLVVWWVLSGQVALEHANTAALVGAVIGYASAKADQVVSFWFGSSAGSREKTEAMVRRLWQKAS